MYNKIPTKINPTETIAKITYASAFDLEFFLLLRERRSTSLAHMQDAVLEVESSILVAEKLRGKYDRDRRKGRLKLQPLNPLLSTLKLMNLEIGKITFC
jgi:hypothetical protein